MTKEQQKQHLAVFHEQMYKTILDKGDDYANEDRLSNFKATAAICGIKPEQVALVMIAIKVARLGVLLGKDVEPLNEPLIDSVLDLANYAVLLDMIILDK